MHSSRTVKLLMLMLFVIEKAEKAKVLGISSFLSECVIIYVHFYHASWVTDFPMQLQHMNSVIVSLRQCLLSLGNPNEMAIGSENVKNATFPQHPREMRTVPFLFLSLIRAATLLPCK